MKPDMDKALQIETGNLIKSWQHHDAAMLRDYLVADVEDPRINAQSILTRHFLIDAITEGRFGALMEQELRFSVAMNWLLEFTRGEIQPEEYAAIRHALERGADNAEGIEIPGFARTLFRTLPVEADGVIIPNFLAVFLERAAAQPEPARLDASSLSLFDRAWSSVLEGLPTLGLSAIEPACGSANDYRFLHTSGIARWLDYTGFDLCEANIVNARAMFPQARFMVGNVFTIPASDDSCDLCFTHDLFEHLSPAGCERALSEVCRVTRRALCLGFFNMHEEADHIVRPVNEYFWNTLSLARIRALVESHGFEVEAIHLETFLKWRLACDRTHNPNAYTLLCRAAT
jgi:hypothetical protein